MEKEKDLGCRWKSPSLRVWCGEPRQVVPREISGQAETEGIPGFL